VKSIAILVISLGIILLGAEVFVNGIEWLGKKLNLSEGAVGSVLAAVGTALPETLIPIIAIVFSDAAQGHEIGIGAILGAPLMLATLEHHGSGYIT
jgi:cation:H+ antiporter